VTMNFRRPMCVTMRPSDEGLLIEESYHALIAPSVTTSCSTAQPISTEFPTSNVRG
jgi:hypothetical protein